MPQNSFFFPSFCAEQYLSMNFSINAFVHFPSECLLISTMAWARAEARFFTKSSVFRLSSSFISLSAFSLVEEFLVGVDSVLES